MRWSPQCHCAALFRVSGVSSTCPVLRLISPLSLTCLSLSGSLAGHGCDGVSKPPPPLQQAVRDGHTKPTRPHVGVTKQSQLAHRLDCAGGRVHTHEVLHTLQPGDFAPEGCVAHRRRAVSCAWME